MKSKIVCLIVMLIVSVSYCKIMADDKHSNAVLSKSDIPQGYYLQERTSRNVKSGTQYQEYWASISPATEKYYDDKYGSKIKIPPLSTISIERLYLNIEIDDRLIRYQKGSTYSPDWKETTPGGKKLGDKCYSITKTFSDGGEFSRILIVKGKSLCTITISNRKNMKSIPKDSAEKLIETIYSRF